MEEAIKVDPADMEAWQVYADYLQTQSDFRGELIALGIAIEQTDDAARRMELQTRYDSIFKPYQIQWLGLALKASANPKVLKLEWRYGYVMKARVAHEYDFAGPGSLDLLKKVLSKPAGQFIQALVLGVNEGAEDGDVSFDAYIEEIVNSAPGPGLKQLVIGDFESEECEISWSTVGNCEPLFSALPDLQSLRLHGGRIELGNLTHAKLKHLTIETGGLSAEAVRSVAAARLPALESLEVWFGADDYGAEGNISMLAPLFEGQGFPALKQLGLMNCEFENEIAGAIVKAPVLKQLETLDLSMGTMTDEGADALINNSSALQHLKELNVEDNFISPAKQEQLRQSFGDKIKIGTQDEYDDEYLYVSVGE